MWGIEYNVKRGEGEAISSSRISSEVKGMGSEISGKKIKIKKELYTPLSPGTPTYPATTPRSDVTSATFPEIDETFCDI